MSLKEQRRQMLSLGTSSKATRVICLSSQIIIPSRSFRHRIDLQSKDVSCHYWPSTLQSQAHLVFQEALCPFLCPMQPNSPSNTKEVSNQVRLLRTVAQDSRAKRKKTLRAKSHS